MNETISIDALKTMVGREIGVSSWRILGQDDIDRFAQLTGDNQWIHVDVPRAKREMGGTIAHGLLTLSLLPSLSGSVLRVKSSRALNYGFDKVRFIHPVRAGARIRLRVRLVSVEEKSGGFLVKRECTMEIEGEDKPALVAESLSLYFP